MRTVIALIAAAFVASATPARAQDADACAAFKWPIARERRAFGTQDLPTLSTGGAFPAVGKGAAVTLSPEEEVAYTVKPARPPKSSPAYGAELSLADTGGGGSLQVTLSTEGWIDVVQGGKLVRSSAFSGKTGCPGIRKSVRFTVAPGPLAIAISDAPEPTLKLAVMPVEQGQ